MKTGSDSSWYGLIVTAVIVTGCVPNRPPSVKLARDVERPDRSALIFIVDGMDRSRLRELLAEGRLPHIQTGFVEAGVSVEHAVASLPSITYPNAASTVTGVYPGHHGILGNHWFDPIKGVFRDYATLNTHRQINGDLGVPAMCNLLPDELTATIQYHTNHGADIDISYSPGFLLAYSLGMRDSANCHIAACFEDLIRTANRLKRWPAVTIMYFPTTDDTGHLWGAESPQFEKAIVNIDRLLGWILSVMQSADLTDSSYVVLVSDHGMAPCRPGHVLDLPSWLARNRDMRIGTKLTHAGGFFDLLTAYDALVLTDGGRVANIHLRGPEGWQERPSPGRVLDWLTRDPPVHQLPAIAVAAMRDGTDRVCALTAGGFAVIERRRENTGWEYRIETSDAELFCPGAGHADWHTAGEWLALTAGTRFPDFIAQAVDLFDSPRTGDVMLFAAEGWSFDRGLRGGHGSCLARDMLIPMYFAGPDLPAGETIPHARLVDLMPTVLGLLEKTDRLDSIGAIDGINRAEQLRHPPADQRN